MVIKKTLGRKYDEEFYAGLAEGSVRSAELMLSRLFSVYKPSSVVDFGCGVGAWLSAAGKLGATELKGYDGNWVNKGSLLSDRIDFTPVSLEESVSLSKKYDLAISVEVAEHLTPKRAEGFVKQLCSASDCVVFGAAIKGQGGTHHINEQWQSYWIKLFDAAGYECFDIFRGALWGDERIEWWYRQNIFLFVNRGADSSAINKDALRALQMPITDIVHPEHLTKIIDNPLIAIKRYFQNKINSR